MCVYFGISVYTCLMLQKILPHLHVYSHTHTHTRAHTHTHRYSPIGIASIIAGKLAEVDDFGVLVAEVGLYVVTVMTGLLIHGCIVLPLLYLIMTRKNPLKVVRAVLQALLTAFGTSSRYIVCM